MLLTLAILSIGGGGRLRDYLAIFLGLSGTALAILQYAPQIYKTYNAKLVGALSLGTMAIQVPGSVLFVISIAVREGTNWTSWIPYAVTGAMQGGLLVSPSRSSFNTGIQVMTLMFRPSAWLGSKGRRRWALMISVTLLS